MQRDMDNGTLLYTAELECFGNVKGIAHPKMKICGFFIHP